ncbi:uncharacterized protein CEXT_370641 [Caerostris extrusa]|uniref:Uncharacterized protein n=1 Tax=Caerostris extrusa TaxID=172846 RepID=A0AAV4PBJ8_CAEEX|nr:uncharacterized protein CEXT_370641 [Caerostris extrusa]
MEETLRSFCETESRNDTSGECGPKSNSTSSASSVLFFDECLEVVHGFQTYVTILPQLNKPCARSSLPVVMLTLYQRDTTEGICRHFQSLIRTLVEHKTNIPLQVMVAELNSKYKELVLDICAETINEIQTENLSHTFPGKSPEQMVQLLKEKILRPCILSYPEFLRRNTQEVIRTLTSTDPSYFLSPHRTSAIDCLFHLGFQEDRHDNPGTDPVIRDMWKVWGHEQISRKVFPVTMAAATPLANLGPLYSHLDTGSEAVVNVGTLSHVPVKEGLQSVIKCLKSQDISQISTIPAAVVYANSTPITTNIKTENVCKHELRVFSISSSTSKETAHVQRLLQQIFCVVLSSSVSVSSFSYHRHQHHSSFISTSAEASRSQHSDYLQSYDLASTEGPGLSSRTGYGPSSHVVQPVPHYLPMNLKAFSQRMLYGYPVINKPQYPLSIPSRSNH